MRAAVGGISWGTVGGLAPFRHPYIALEVQSTAPGGIRVPEGQPRVLPGGRFGMRGLHMAGRD